MQPDARTTALTTIALVAFASNSILCRLALGSPVIDAGTFTFVRLLSGAITLLLLVVLRDRRIPALKGRWFGALALFVYAVPFSFAYLRIPAGTGALILFGAVQATMMGWGLFRGHRLRAGEVVGLVLALSGLVVLTYPGTTATDPAGAALMAVAGIAWGVYSVLGRGSSDPLGATAGNFSVSLLYATPLLLIGTNEAGASAEGIGLAIASGAVASGLGYAVWYSALRGLSSPQAGIVQLLVPVLAAGAGVLVLDETVTVRLVLSGGMIFAGVVLAVRGSLPRKGIHLMKHTLTLFLLLATTVVACAQQTHDGDPVVVPTVDLQRYSGVWYEIARLPNPFQRHCAGDVTATYRLLDDGQIKVINRCLTEEGEISEAEGRARLASEDGPTSKLKVRFAPAFLSFLPFVWGDYWVLELAPDYSHAVVGDPDRKYLWVLARSPAMEEETLSTILDRARQQGYNVGGIIRTIHTR